MSTDVYQPCPCGSGKKLKFCCLDIHDEMMKVSRLQEREQYRQALSLLEKIEQKHRLKPDSQIWVLLTRATVQMTEGEAEAAQTTLDAVLELDSEHLLALALKATAAFTADGFEIAKPLIHRAFKKCGSAYPELISSLAMGIAGEMHLSGSFLGAREHLALAMRTAPEQDRQEVFMHLLQLEGNAEIPYPLRSVHQLRRPKEFQDGDGPEADTFQKAMLKAGAGCFSEAATTFDKLASDHGEIADLHVNIGYCRAFDGNEVQAATSLHRAAELTEDFGAAVEAETIAQILELAHGEQVEILSIPFGVTSVSQLLSKLDEASPRIVRLELPPPEPDEDPKERPAGVYELLGTDLPSSSPEEWTREQVPTVAGQLTVFSTQGTTPPAAYLTGQVGEQLDEIRHLVQTAAGDLLTDHPNEQTETAETIPAELAFLSWRWYFPPKTPTVHRRQLEQEQWRSLIDNEWMTNPLAALDGKTPSEAAGEETLRVALAGCLLILDVFCDRNRYHLDFAEMCERLQLPTLPTIEVTPETALQSFSILQMHRLPVEQLDDRQLQTALNRALLTNHRRYLHRVLTEVLQRPDVMAEVDLDRVYLTLADLAREKNDRVGTLQWIERGQAELGDRDDTFEDRFRWAMRELAHRMEDPSDPDLRKTIDHVWNYYGPKLPQIRVYLTELLTGLGLPLPTGDGQPTGSTTSGGIWTPESESTGGGGRKLWVPGED